MSSVKPKLKVSINLAPLKKLAKQSPKMFSKAMEVGGIQFLTWANTGTGKTPKKPPIRYGVLRGSSSVFVGNKLVTIYQQSISPGADEAPSPATSHQAPMHTMTAVWNTNYAVIMHEHKGNWGPITSQDTNAGSKWVEENLKANKDLLMEVIAKNFKKRINKV